MLNPIEKQARILRQEGELIYLQLEDGQLISWEAKHLPSITIGNQLSLRLLDKKNETEQQNVKAIEVLNELLKVAT